MTGGFLAYTAESKKVGPSPIVIFTLQPFSGHPIILFFFFSILPIVTTSRSAIFVAVVVRVCGGKPKCGRVDSVWSVAVVGNRHENIDPSFYSVKV